MPVFRFIHTADLHLDSPFKGLGHFPKQKVNEIYESTFQSFDRIVNYCIEKDVNFLLIAGDVYDGEEQSLRAQIHLKRELERLDAKGIDTFIVHGNHDPLSKEKRRIKWPERVHFFPKNKWKQFHIIKRMKRLLEYWEEVIPRKHSWIIS
ncbi:DNA repair exonuclease [Tepidibacillus marianensis]|uniref:metallophosphoesterase family protein n=1 Tax=Tepidibacillus marianensis TaxID=3131995 RepID=UPI0030D5DDE1